MLEVLVCCYGDHPDISDTCIRRIYDLADDIKDLRIIVGVNQGSPATIQKLRQLYDRGVISVLVESKENRNKDPMMRVLLEHVNEEYFVWFDDDTYPLQMGWDTKTKSVIADGPFEAAGFVHVTHRKAYVGYLDFLQARPWFESIEKFSLAKDPNLLNSAVFPHGAFWIGRTNFLRKNDFPDRLMVKKADDMLLGELIAQKGGRLKPIYDMWDVWIAVNKGPRRGNGETGADGWKGIVVPQIKLFPEGLTIYPTGGMCNRLRNIISAIVLCREEKAPLRVIWESDSSQTASTDIADYWSMPSDVVLEYATTAEIMEMHYREQGRGNLYGRIPREKLKGGYHNYWGLACLEGEEVNTRRYDEGMAQNVLPLNIAWQKKVDEQAASIGVNKNTVGVHIRAFEAQQGERKPEQIALVINNFLVKIDGAKEIYLATDSKEVFQAIFNSRAVVHVMSSQSIEKQFLDRESKADFEHGIMDCYLLGKCGKVLGTKASSFSHHAGLLAGKIEWVEGVRECKEVEGL